MVGSQTVDDVLRDVWVFGKFLRMSDGTPTYPVVLLLGISSWQFVTESTNIGLRSVVDRGDLLRKIHFPNYIVVVSATIGALIQLRHQSGGRAGFSPLVARVQFTWRVVLLPLNIIELYAITTAFLRWIQDPTERFCCAGGDFGLY